MSLVKLAGFGSMLLSAGSTLMKNNVFRNAAIGSGIGAVTGAAQANSGERISGAFKGGLLGGTVGGLGTYGKNVFNTAKQFQQASGLAGAPMKLSQTVLPAIKSENGILKDTLSQAWGK